MDSSSVLDGIQHNYGWVYPLCGLIAGGFATRLRSSREKRLAAARENLKELVELTNANVITIPKARLNRGRRYVEALAADLYDKRVGPPFWSTVVLAALFLVVTPVPVLMSSFLSSDQLKEDVPQNLLVAWLIAMSVILVLAVILLVWTLVGDAIAYRLFARIKLWLKRRRRKRRVQRRACNRSGESRPTDGNS